MSAFGCSDFGRRCRLPLYCIILFVIVSILPVIIMGVIKMITPVATYDSLLHTADNDARASNNKDVVVYQQEYNTNCLCLSLWCPWCERHQCITDYTYDGKTCSELMAFVKVHNSTDRVPSFATKALTFTFDVYAEIFSKIFDTIHKCTGRFSKTVKELTTSVNEMVNDTLMTVLYWLVGVSTVSILFAHLRSGKSSALLSMAINTFGYANHTGGLIVGCLSDLVCCLGRNKTK